MEGMRRDLKSSRRQRHTFDSRAFLSRSREISLRSLWYPNLISKTRCRGKRKREEERGEEERQSQHDRREEKGITHISSDSSAFARPSPFFSSIDTSRRDSKTDLQDKEDSGNNRRCESAATQSYIRSESSVTLEDSWSLSVVSDRNVASKS